MSVGDALQHRALAHDELGDGRAQLAPPLIGAKRVLHDVGLAGLVHELRQGDAVLGEKRHALTLPVIRQDDDVVRTVSGLCRMCDATERLVDAAQHVEGVVALDTGVMRDLVVADKRRVDDGASGVGIGDYGLHRDIAQDHHRDGTQQRVADAAMHARDDVAAQLLRGGVQLATDVEQAEDERTKDGVRVGEVRVVVLAA